MNSTGISMTNDNNSQETQLWIAFGSMIVLQLVGLTLTIVNRIKKSACCEMKE
jgi:hypothetical protein